MCAKAVSSKPKSNFLVHFEASTNYSVVPWHRAAFNARQFSRQELLNKQLIYYDEMFQTEHCMTLSELWFCVPTIFHSCGILLLAQAHPKIPCIYTSYTCIVSPFALGRKLNLGWLKINRSKQCCIFLACLQPRRSKRVVRRAVSAWRARRRVCWVRTRELYSN